MRQSLDVTKTTVIGLGQMGRGIARNLDAHGLLCAAFDTDKVAFSAAELSDRVTEISPDLITDAADFLVFAVPSTREIDAFFSAVPGRSGQVVVDLTTSDPKHSRALGSKLAERGLHFIDAAMTGGAAGADTGMLTLMLGGEADNVAACRPILKAISDKTFHLGPVGAGHAMKLVHNLILHTSFLATCEGLQMAKRAGIDVTGAVDVLNAGNARSFVTETRFPRDILSGTMMARSRIANLEKDLGLAVDFAAGVDARVPFAKMTSAVLAKAMVSGHADTDFSWLFPFYDELVDRLEAEE